MPNRQWGWPARRARGHARAHIVVADHALEATFAAQGPEGVRWGQSPRLDLPSAGRLDSSQDTGRRLPDLGHQEQCAARRADP
jgi:hypothetical protein